MAQLQADQPVFDHARLIRAELIETNGDFHTLRAPGIAKDWKAHRNVVTQAAGAINSVPQEST